MPCTKDKVVTGVQADRSFGWGALDYVLWKECGEIRDGSERRETSELDLKFTCGMLAKTGCSCPAALADSA